MPKLSKSVVSMYMRTGCERQLGLRLYDADERERHGMPESLLDVGLSAVKQAGIGWQSEREEELRRAAGAGGVLEAATRTAAEGSVAQFGLTEVIADLRPGQFVIEPFIGVHDGDFLNNLGLAGRKDRFGDPVELSDLVPDLIQVLPAATAEEIAEAGAGRREPLLEEVSPDGTVRPISDDGRLRLRVIDYKMSAEPGSHHWAELAIYSVALSCWLAHHQGLDGRNWGETYAVSAAPGIWSLSETGSELSDLVARGPVPLDPARLTAAVEMEIEVAPFEVFAIRLRRFFREDLPGVLARRWDELRRHVCASCRHCEFLGHPDTHPGSEAAAERLCWNEGLTAESLSLVAGMPRAGVDLLGRKYPTVTALSEASPGDPVFEASHSLRALRHLFTSRAKALRTGEVGLVDAAGTSATMPKLPDLRIALFLEYDLVTRSTAAFGLRALWVDPHGRSGSPRRRKSWSDDGTDGDGFTDVFLAEERTVRSERNALLGFLRAVNAIVSEVREQDGPRPELRSTFQIYLWNAAQREQLVRVVTRHFEAVEDGIGFGELSWLLVPQKDRLANPQDPAWSGPLTVVNSVVARTVAAPLPYHYGLIDLARRYRPAKVDAVKLPWRDGERRYREVFTDLLPGERLWELWGTGDATRKKKPREDIGRALRTKLTALAHVVGRLEIDLRARPDRSAAPPLVRASSPRDDLPPPSRHWLEYAKLNVAAQDLEGRDIRAMSITEREARLHSARLLRRLEGGERHRALARLAESSGASATEDRAVVEDGSMAVYEMAESSLGFRAKPGEPGYALVPDSHPELLNWRVDALGADHPSLDIPGWVRGSTVGEAGLAGYSIEEIDREHRLIALKPGLVNRVRELETAARLDFGGAVTLDPYPFDVSVRYIHDTLRQIGWPDSAPDDGRGRRGRVRTPESPASEFLWQAERLAAQRKRTAGGAELERLRRAGIVLDPSQEKAWRHALSHRLSIIWGPPGTGKTTVLSSIAAAAAEGARSEGRGLRVLLSGFTYSATDTLLEGTAKQVRALERMNSPAEPGRTVALHRLRSAGSSRLPNRLAAFDIEDAVVHRSGSFDRLRNLVDDLRGDRGIHIVASVPMRLNALAAGRWSYHDKGVVREWFDLVVLDETSQLGTALSTLCVSKGRTGCTFVLGGDDLQLPPIQQTSPPRELESRGGSVYSYLKDHRGVPTQPLETNYRANRTLVEFTRGAGYGKLVSNSPDLRINLLPGPAPAGGSDGGEEPTDLLRSPVLERFLLPEAPAVAFVYDDPFSGQSNPFEADVVAGLLRLLRGRLGRRLINERGRRAPADANAGSPRHTPLGLSAGPRDFDAPHDEETFWKRAVGVVAPHRAQISEITGRLFKLFGRTAPDARLIRGAVDTTERFQGQQRDIVIASFGVGDLGLIRGEEDFLFNLNRFNVMASRARAKLIVLATRTLLDHLPEEREVLDHSLLLKRYALNYCDNAERIELAGRSGVLRFRNAGCAQR